MPFVSNPAYLHTRRTVFVTSDFNGGRSSNFQPAVANTPPAICVRSQPPIRLHPCTLGTLSYHSRALAHLLPTSCASNSVAHSELDSARDCHTRMTMVYTTFKPHFLGRCSYIRLCPRGHSSIPSQSHLVSYTQRRGL